MNREEATRAIADRVAVTRADIVAAKAYLLSLGADEISLDSKIEEWAAQASPGTPKTLTLFADDIQDQITKVARYMSARLALCSAAWELVRAGVVFLAGPAKVSDRGWEFTDRGNAGGLQWTKQFPLLFPERLWRPAWHDVPSDLFDADLYLQRLAPTRLHVGVERALRMSMECFRRELWVPCVAMLGAASEGAWIEMGQKLAGRFVSDRQAGKLAGTLKDPARSTKAKITAICSFYERPTCVPLYRAATVEPRRLRQIEQWSDQVRESRNVLHWGAAPTVPNTYEKVAILLMDSVSELATLHRLRDAC